MEAEFDRGAAWQALLSLGSDDPDADFDDDRAAQLVHSLNGEGHPQIVEWALAELTDLSPWHRQAAGWVLAEHGRLFKDQVLPALRAAAYHEGDVAARCSLVRAIGYAEDPAVEKDLLHFANDPEPAIREVVAQCLPSVLTEEPSGEVVAALITLTADTNPHVRDWATFAIGQQTQLDSPAIRDALRARLDDYEDNEDGPTATSGEAILALATRHDEAAYPQLLRLLEAPIQDIGNLTIQAAGALGDTRLLPNLIRLRDARWPDQPWPLVLRTAIADLTK